MVVITRKAISLYILGVLLVCAYALLFFSAAAGQNMSPQWGYGYIFWTALFFYYWCKRRARKGWHGAVVGSIIALVTLFAAAFIVGIVRHGA
jgi:hypothetical protein